MSSRSNRTNVKPITTRDPIPQHRDPDPTLAPAPASPPRAPRRYIPASMPIVCPDCGHGTRMDDGRHIDPVRKTILEYRTCSHCHAKLAAGRAMTPREAEKFCSHVDAVTEYDHATRTGTL